MSSTGAVEQAKALKSYRRHMEKQRHCRVRNYNDVVKEWILNKLSNQWRRSYSKNHE